MPSCFLPDVLRVLVASGCAAAAATQDLIVPAGYANVDAPGVGDAPGLMQRFRQQIILDATLLVGRTGRETHALTFRRDGKDQRAFVGGRARIKVTLSPAARSPLDADMVFDRNRGQAPMVVFDGEVAIPASPALPSRNAATWQAPHAVTIAFTSPYIYVSGPLCIDVEGEPVAGATTSWWPLDSFTQAAIGSVARIGQSCVPRSSASASAAWLQAGATNRLIASGQPASVGVAMLGLQLPVPLDLTSIGATGCMLRVSPDVLLPASFSTPSAPDMPGDAQIVLPVPAAPSLAGMTVHNQWVNIERPDARSNPAGLTTTNALALTIATTTLPAVVVTTIRSGLTASGTALPSSGLVLPGRAPVLLLTFQ